MGTPPSEIRRPRGLFKVTAATWRSCDLMLGLRHSPGFTRSLGQSLDPAPPPLQAQCLSFGGPVLVSCPAPAPGPPGGQGQVNRIPA